jgi:hypothetical protein
VIGAGAFLATGQAGMELTTVKLDFGACATTGTEP